MRKKAYVTSASQPTSQPRDFHTHEVHQQSADCTVMIRCYSEQAAKFEQAWQQSQGQVVEIVKR